MKIELLKSFKPKIVQTLLCQGIVKHCDKNKLRVNNILQYIYAEQLNLLSIDVPFLRLQALLPFVIEQRRSQLRMISRAKNKPMRAYSRIKHRVINIQRSRFFSLKNFIMPALQLINKKKQFLLQFLTYQLVWVLKTIILKKPKLNRSQSRTLRFQKYKKNFKQKHILQKNNKRNLLSSKHKLQKRSIKKQAQHKTMKKYRVKHVRSKLEMSSAKRW